MHTTAGAGRGHQAITTALTSSTFARFLVTGGIAAAVNFGSRFVFSTFTSFGVAVLLAYGCGMIVAFLSMRRYVFGKTDNTTTQSALWFIAVNLVAVAQVWVVSVGLEHVIFPKVGFDLAPEAVAHAIGIVVPVFTSYAGHTRFSFKAAAE